MARYARFGKQILRDGKNFAQAEDDESAEVLLTLCLREEASRGVRGPLPSPPGLGAKPIKVGWWLAGAVVSGLLWTAIWKASA